MLEISGADFLNIWILYKRFLHLTIIFIKDSHYLFLKLHHVYHPAFHNMQCLCVCLHLSFDWLVPIASTLKCCWMLTASASLAQHCYAQECLFGKLFGWRCDNEWITQDLNTVNYQGCDKKAVLSWRIMRGLAGPWPSSKSKIYFGPKPFSAWKNSSSLKSVFDGQEANVKIWNL